MVLCGCVGPLWGPAQPCWVMGVGLFLFGVGLWAWIEGEGEGEGDDVQQR